MSIKIKTEKIITGEEQARKIISIDLLEYFDLPVKYLTDGARAYKEEKAVRVDTDGGTLFVISVGDEIEEKKFLRQIEEIKKCGTRLHKINLSIDLFDYHDLPKKHLGDEIEEKKFLWQIEKNKDWHGKETFVI